MAFVVEEENLDFSRFHCRGDEDLYPFGCPRCDHHLNDLSRHGREQVNALNPEGPSFACPRCGCEFEYRFMHNPLYRIPKAKWFAAVYARLLQASQSA